MKIIAVVLAVVIAVPVIAAGVIVIDDMEANPDAVNVFLLAGQSNAQYFRTDVTVANAELASIPDDSAYYYGTDEMPLSPGAWSNMNYDTTLESYSIHPMVNGGEYTIGGVEAALASGFVTDTGEKCLVINVGIGGVSVGMYTPGGLAYDYAKKVFFNAISKCPSDWVLNKCSVVWIQGEANTSTPVAEYMEDFIIMWDAMRSTFGFDSILISKVRAVNGVNSSVAQIYLADSVPGVYMATEVSDTFTIDNGLMTSDDLHYSQKGDNLIGVAVANYYYDHLYHTGDTNQYAPLLKLVPVFSIIAIFGVIVALVVRSRY